MQMTGRCTAIVTILVNAPVLKRKIEINHMTNMKAVIHKGLKSLPWIRWKNRAVPKGMTWLSETWQEMISKWMADTAFSRKYGIAPLTDPGKKAGEIREALIANPAMQIVAFFTLRMAN